MRTEPYAYDSGILNQVGTIADVPVLSSHRDIVNMLPVHGSGELQSVLTEVRKKCSGLRLILSRPSDPRLSLAVENHSGVQPLSSRHRHRHSISLAHGYDAWSVKLSHLLAQVFGLNPRGQPTQKPLHLRELAYTETDLICIGDLADVPLFQLNRGGVGGEVLVQDNPEDDDELHMDPTLEHALLAAKERGLVLILSGYRVPKLSLAIQDGANIRDICHRKSQKSHSVDILMGPQSWQIRLAKLISSVLICTSPSAQEALVQEVPQSPSL